MRISYRLVCAEAYNLHDSCSVLHLPSRFRPEELSPLTLDLTLPSVTLNLQLLNVKLDLATQRSAPTLTPAAWFLRATLALMTFM